MSLSVDREIQSGDASTLIWGFGPVEAPYIPPGAQFELEIDYLLPTKTNTVFKSSEGKLIVNYETGNVSWMFSKQFSLSLPVNHRIGYTLRRVYNGETYTPVYGNLIVKTGVPL